MLCEFTSCVTPSAVGGSSPGMVFLWSQGINFGRATTLMMTTLFLDELFFRSCTPLVALFTPDADAFRLRRDIFLPRHQIDITDCLRRFVSVDFASLPRHNSKTALDKVGIGKDMQSALSQTMAVGGSFARRQYGGHV